MIHKNKLFSFNSELYKVTGVQKVLMDIHVAVKEEYSTKIVGTIPFNKVNKIHGINKEEYIKFHNPFMFYDSIVVLHERKYLILFWILNHFLFQKIKLVYVNHSLFNDKRLLCWMPENVVALSNSGINNLRDYFKVPMNHIHKIHNCVRDDVPNNFVRNIYNENKIKIIYPGGIGVIKRQIDIVNHLKGKLDKRIEINFVGTGSLLPKLKEITAGDDNFKVHGFIAGVHQMMLDCDYTMLFSSKEGLPITLIESTMSSLPIICNNVGGNTEIAENGKNAFVIDSWNELLKILNSLPYVNCEKYLQMCRQSRKIYEERFTFNLFKKNYISMLRNM